MGSAIAVTGCDRAPETTQTNADDFSVVSFGDAFQQRKTVRLEQPFDYPIATVSGVALADDGSFVLTDRSEGRISVFSPDGSLLETFGGRGQGPGEFQRLRAPRIGNDGRIHVVDTDLRRISVLSESGELLQEISTPDDFYVNEMAVDDEGYILAGVPVRSGASESVIRIAADGSVLSRRERPAADGYPAGERETGRWGSLAGFSVSSSPDTAYVIGRLFDSLWAVPHGPGETRSTHLAIGSYEAPSMPDPEPRVAPEILEWAAQQMLAYTVRGSDGALIVPFAKGRYLDGERGRTMAAFRTPAGEWLTLVGTPVLLDMNGGELLTLEPSELGAVVLGVYDLAPELANDDH